jgi:hypothetical protein
MDIDSNVDKIVAGWTARVQALRPRLREATVEVTRVVYSESKAQMTELIYDKPIPTVNQLQAEKVDRQRSKGRSILFKKSGRYGLQKKNTVAYKKYGAKGDKPAWRRTGNLRRNERMRIVSDFEGMIENRAASSSKKGKVSPYALARHNKKRTRFPAPWRARAIAIALPKCRRVYRGAIIKAMKTGIVPGI